MPQHAGTVVPDLVSIWEMRRPRDIVLVALENHGRQSVNQLVQRLGLTELQVRNHLGSLRRDGCAVATGTCPTCYEAAS